MRQVLSLAVALTAVGCATMPVTGAPATGEKLSIERHTELKSTTEKVKVGEVNYTTSSGQSAGKAEVYQDQTRYYTETKWYLAQGKNRIDDYDFFKIAGDEAAANEIEAYRETGMKMNRGGLAALLSGIGVATAGGFLTIPNETRTPGSIVALTGVVTGLIGYFIWNAGANRLNPETHPLDVGRAQVAAASYNQNPQAAKVESADPPNRVFDTPVNPVRNTAKNFELKKRSRK